jgi:hypothetical protein
MTSKPNRDQLTEALALHQRALSALALELPAQVFEDYKAIATVLDEAARWARDFPTDVQVEACAKALCLYAWGADKWEDDHKGMWREQARAALEAVTMIGDNQ